MSKGLISSGLERVYPSKVPPATLGAARRAPEDHGATAEPSWRDVVHEVMNALGKPGYLDAVDAVLLEDTGHASRLERATECNRELIGFSEA